MAFTVPHVERTFDLPTEGPHIARLFQIIDLGQHDFQGDGKFKRRVFLNFELPDELMTDNRPFAIGLECSVVVDPKNKKAFLPKLISSLYGRELTESDVKSLELDFADNLIGKACSVEVANKKTKQDSVWPTIISHMKLRKTEVVPPPVNKTLIFSLEDSHNIDEVKKTLPDFLFKKINFGA